MRMVMSLVLSAALLVIVAVPVQAATLVQVFSCTVNEGYTEDDLTSYIAEFLQKARSIKGGEKLEITMNFHVAPQSDSIDIVAKYASFADWGHFIDDLPGTPLMDLIDNAKSQGKFTCSGGNISTSVPVATE